MRGDSPRMLSVDSAPNPLLSNNATCCFERLRSFHLYGPFGPAHPVTIRVLLASDN